MGDTRSLELMGMENVLEVISNVNIRQVDTKTNQLLKDVVEAKTNLSGRAAGSNCAAAQSNHGVTTLCKRPVSKAQRLF